MKTKGQVPLMSNQISTPGNLSFKDWVSDLNNSLPNSTIPVAPETEKEWKKWAYEFIQSNSNNAITLPSGDDWRTWAYFLAQDMNSS